MFGFRTGRTYVRRYRATPQSKQDERKVQGGILYIIALILLGFWAHSEYHEKEMRLAFDEVQDIIQYPQSDAVNYHNKGKLIYFSTDQINPSDILVDQDFQLISPPSTLNMKRVEEYCQWIEVQERQTRRDSEGNTEEYITYHYTKQWVATPIISVFYDQAFSHHNPLRQPFPSKYWQTERAQAGAYNLQSDIISSFNSFAPYELSPAQFTTFYNSPAYQLEKFNYIGGGYFYSAYEEQTAFRLARMFGQMMEGSLLDFQLVDFFPQCTAGDVRVHFEVGAPNQISVVGQQLDEHGNVGVYLTSRNFKVGFVHEGIHTVDEIFDKELSDHHFNVLILRGVLSLFIYVIICFHTDLEFSNSAVLTFSLSFLCSFFAAAFLLLYPFSLLSFLALLFGVGGSAFTFSILFYPTYLPPEVTPSDKPIPSDHLKSKAY